MRYRDLFPFVLAEAPQVPAASLILALREAVRELCRRSRIWSEELLPVQTVAGRTVYALNFPQDSELAQIGEVWIAGKKWTPLEPKEARSQVRDGSSDSFYWCHNRTDLTIYPAQAAGLPIVVDAALQPTLESQEFPDEIGVGRERLIAKGALAYVLDLAGKEWTNHDLAAKRRAEFLEGCDSAAIDSATGASDGLLTVDTYDLRAM